MKRQLILLLGIGVINLFLFIIVFVLFQNEKIYNHTMAMASQNYERTEDGNNYKIKKVSKPYIKVDNESVLQWDASIYKCISERMYKLEDKCYGKVRAVFFPLFPFLWKVTNSTSIVISLINYLMFILSISILVISLLQGSGRYKLIVYSILLTMPSSIIYYIPYTESLFLFTMTIAFIGIIKDKYWICFLGFLLLSMVRPATIFVLFALYATEFFVYIEMGGVKVFVKRIVLITIPFFIGYSCSIIIQYLYTGSWYSFIEAQHYWSGGIQKITKISDWSFEGFGMNLFSVVFITLLALAFIFISILNRSNKVSILKNISIDKSKYLFSVSLLYLIGILLFTLITSGGNLHSFFRFTLASPFFYIAILILLNYLLNFNTLRTFVFLFVLTGMLIISLRQIDYGGDRLQFSFMGLYLLIFSFWYLGLRKLLIKQIDYVILCFLLLMNIIWNTFLFNVYLSDGWVFT